MKLSATHKPELIAGAVIAGIATLVVSVIAVGGIVSPSSQTKPSTQWTARSASPTIAVEKGSVLYAAQQLHVAEPQPHGYSRDEFGQRWADVDRNGCDQRNDVLRRDLAKRHIKPGTNGCVLRRGVTQNGTYGRDNLKYKRGGSKVDIDHVVSLADAWRMGAYNWSANRREKFANDFIELEAVDAKTHRDKGDSAADEWLPKDPDQQCSYAARQVQIKTLFGLAVTKAERTAIVAALTAEDCDGGNWPLPERSDYRVPKPKAIGEPKPKPSPKPEPEPSQPSVRKGVHPGASPHSPASKRSSAPTKASSRPRKASELPPTSSASSTPPPPQPSITTPPPPQPSTTTPPA
jgi:Protein of unknown function (DUF1524)